MIYLLIAAVLFFIFIFPIAITSVGGSSREYSENININEEWKGELG